jgi:hypothetical protein
LAAIRRAQARGGALPAHLEEACAGLDASWRLDPFTGKDLCYASAEGELRLYGAGPDGGDDGGADAPWRRGVDPKGLRDLVLHRGR